MSPQTVYEGAKTTAADLADNIVLRLLARLSMLLCMPVAIWFGSQFMDVRDKALMLANTVNALADRIDERTADRYTGSIAARDWAEQARRDTQQDAAIDRNQTRIDSNDVRLRKLEIDGR
ncbi:hypothetical protein L0F51_03800 [Afifella sp. H1R]|uniref:hypothetical protein n=1 Tax=Afifella sp. H1R TaxID=2908841 RepID=UPI001F2AFB9B|nr:hypothetical protein [Afifella sp. H1R]MCF1502889.1 hypothetical protein [Afifella sp. H1R]